MSYKSIYAIATTRDQASAIVDDLLRAGFLPDDISALFPDKDSSHEFSHEKHTKAPEGATTGAAAGGLLGGGLGLLAGIGALAIPGVGPLIAAGPLMAALSGAAVGASVGGVAGALIGLGIPEIEAKRFENRVAEGNILLSVRATGDGVGRAKDILKNGGAEDISVTSLDEVSHSS